MRNGGCPAHIFFAILIILITFAAAMNIRDRQILQIALPSIISNITVPLLGLVDVAIVGHMGSAAYIGAVAVGSMIFNLIYWLFGFLRMGSSGLTSQALGRRDLTEVVRMLGRSLTISLSIALALIVLQAPLKWLMFRLLGPTPDVAPYASVYFYIVIWGAPASLGLFSLMGWYIGMQNTRIPMLVSIGQNVVNILASLMLVYGLDMKVEGVAFGTLIAQYTGLLVALLLLKRYYGRLFRYFKSDGLFKNMQAFFHVNRDIFLRTLCLVGVNLFFTSAGARQGAVILSVNTVMMQLYLFFSYFMDGFAYAGEALGGRVYGARNMGGFRELLRHLFRWAAVITILYTVVYVFAGARIISMLTDEPQVLAASEDYFWWTWLIPAAGVLAFIWDGVFVGITATRGMLISAFASTLIFFAVYQFSLRFSLFEQPNNSLWLAMIVYLLTRGAIQSCWYRLMFCSSTSTRLPKGG